MGKRTRLAKELERFAPPPRAAGQGQAQGQAQGQGQGAGMGQGAPGAGYGGNVLGVNMVEVVPHAAKPTTAG